MWDDVVTILVGSGPEQKSFVIHAQKLVAVSGLFKDMMNNGHSRRPIELRNTSPKLFDRFCEFCYSGLLESDVPPNVPNVTLDLDSVSKVRVKLKLVELIDCWLMGHDLWAPSFQNESLRTWNIKFAASQTGYEMLDVKLAWEQKTIHPRLRTFLIDAYAYGNPKDLWKAPFTKAESWPIDFLQKLMLARELKPRKVNQYVGVLNRNLDNYMESGPSLNQITLEIDDDSDNDNDANDDAKHVTESAQHNAVSQSNADDPASIRDLAACAHEADVGERRIVARETAGFGAGTCASLFLDKAGIAARGRDDSLIYESIDDSS